METFNKVSFVEGAYRLFIERSVVGMETFNEVFTVEEAFSLRGV